MKKTDWFFNAALITLIIGIIVVVVFKFVIKDKEEASFGIKSFGSITVLDLNGDRLQLKNLIDKDEDTYCFIFELSNCFSCIYKGLEDLKKLKDSGTPCIAVVVHDLLDEVGGWSANYDFSPFLVLKKIDFYKNIRSALMPVIVKLNDGKVKSFRYITP